MEKRYLKRHSLSGAAAAADQKVNEQQKRRMDGTLLILVLLLVVCGLIFLYSTSAYNGRVKFHDPAYYFKKQLFATSLGMMGMYLVSCMDYHVLTKMAPFLYVVSMGLSLAVLLFGDEYNGSKRWLSIGPLSFQPSEFAKVAVILLLTYVITNSRKRQDSLLHMAGTMALLLPIVGLVGTNNLSTAIIILGIGVILIFVSNPKYLPFVGIGGVGVLFIGIFLSMASYRLERIAIWRNPEKYEKGFQTIQGLYAIGSGGIFGKGLGSSLQKLGFVPEAQNDMIFSIICEETGLIGACLLILIFALLIWRLMVIATHARDLCGALIAAGIMGHMAIQVILNIAVVTNTIPNTGITLPFVSYGGTSVLFLMGEMGLALSVSRTRSP
ncbi:putative lipid II flippase FtsW [Blautia producta]